MVMKASEIEHREATEQEDKHLHEMPVAELEEFLAEATVVRKGTTLFAVVDGIAYHIEELADNHNS